jgi:hypothetical protein
MPRLDTVWVLLLAIPPAAFANAQPTRDVREARSDHHRLALDAEWNERDAREVADFERLTMALRDAGRDRMTGRYREVNARVQAAMTREIEQAQVRSAQAEHEARQSQREARGERMEASASGETHDLLQASDDRRDARDDARDRDHALARYREMARIGTMSTALQNEIDGGSRAAMRRNVELAEGFLALMRRDLAAARTESLEDRTELREDRRERRTDRR